MIKEIFNAITPENIKTDPLYSQAIELFIGALEEHSKYSINIHDVFTSDDPAIRIQFLKTFYNSFYEIMKGISGGLDGMILPDIETVLSNEYLYMSKFFKESKGTARSIKYIYALIERLLAAYLDPERAPFKFTDTGIPFYFSVEGAISRELYDLFVKPLAHPLGFAYVYSQIKLFGLHDYFNISYTYSVQKFNIVCPAGQIFPIDITTVKDIDDSELGIRNQPTRIFYLKDGSYIKQIGYPSITVTHFDSNNMVIFAYPAGCFVDILYGKIPKILTIDELQFEIDANIPTDVYNELTETKLYEVDFDTRANWKSIKRTNTPATVVVPQPEWDEVYGQVCYHPFDEIGDKTISQFMVGGKNRRKVQPIKTLNINNTCQRLEEISEQAGINKFYIGGKSTSIIDYRYLKNHIRHEMEGDFPIVSEDLLAGHFIIGGMFAVTEIPIINHNNTKNIKFKIGTFIIGGNYAEQISLPIVDGVSTFLENDFTTELFDLQEFVDEDLDIIDLHTFIDTAQELVEDFTSIEDKGLTDDIYSSNDPAYIADYNLTIGTFQINGTYVRSIVDSIYFEFGTVDGFIELLGDGTLGTGIE